MIACRRVHEKQRKHTAVCEPQSIFMLIKIFKASEKNPQEISKTGEKTRNTLIFFKWKWGKKKNNESYLSLNFEIWDVEEL